MDSANAFQAGMLEALGNLVCSCVLIWIKDLIVYAKDFEELLQALEKVFES
jgi:GT2 family glycosyltransferase